MDRCVELTHVSSLFLQPLQVMVVAQVRSVQPQTTNIVYRLDDSTAEYEARQWVDPNSDDETKRDIR